MGCGASVKRQEPPPQAGPKGPRGDFFNVPPALVHSRGPNERVPTAFDDGRHAKNIDTLGGGILVAPRHPTKLDALFLLPEYSVTATADGKRARPAPQIPGSDRLVGDPTGREDTNEEWKVDKIAREQQAGKYRELPWAATVCQVKEFDSLDDVQAPWTDATGLVPGVFNLEPAGATAAWATLSPNQYQQRWVLPDGARVASFDEVSRLSIPQRIERAFSAGGGSQMLSKLVESLNEGLQGNSDWLDKLSGDDGTGRPTKSSAAATASANNASLPCFRAFRKSLTGPFDVQQYAQRLKDEIANCATYRSVHQLPAAFGPFKTLLAYLEDLLLYNWFEVAVDAEVEIGTSYFIRAEMPRQKYTQKSWYDNVQRRAIDISNELIDTTFAAFKYQVKQLSRKLLQLVFGEGKKGEAMAEALFPDIDSIMDANLASVDSELVGCSTALPAPMDMSPTEVRALFELWHREENQPVEQRRRKFYEDTTQKFASMARKVQKTGDPEQIARLLRQSRIPQLLPQHFFEFDFFLLFPQYKESNKNDCRRPNDCVLSIWPENCPGLGQNVKMSILELPHDEDRGGVLSALAGGVMDDGDDSVSDDADDDPRANWPEYPSTEFRGYRCTFKAALDFNYSFNFSMDKRLFLDHNSYFSKEEQVEREYYRRVRFSAASRPYTYNPLRSLGLAL